MEEFRCGNRKGWPVKGRHWCHQIGLDSLFQKTASTIQKEKKKQLIVQQTDCICRYRFKPGFEIVKFQTKL
jgi:hypothetical protein